jgi:hypothetical protein
MARTGKFSTHGTGADRIMRVKYPVPLVDARAKDVGPAKGGAGVGRRQTIHLIQDNPVGEVLLARVGVL